MTPRFRASQRSLARNSIPCREKRAPSRAYGSADRRQNGIRGRHDLGRALFGRRARTAMTPSKSWREFWEGETPIYVNERHKLLHYRGIARDILQVMDRLPGRAPHEGAPRKDGNTFGFRPVVLDQGCGEALSAGEIAACCERLYLCDAAASVRARLKARFAGVSNIVVINPVEVADISESSVDLVVANSLVQYLARPEFASLL